MAEYMKAKGGKLKLKGEKTHKHKKHKKRKHGDESDATLLDSKEEEKDKESHGGWWCVQEFEDISGQICIEMNPHSYVKALDNGLFVVGPPHPEGEGPSPEEILSAIKIDDSRIALKSGYGKYLKPDKDGAVTGRSDAVGPMEYWEPVFQEGKLALLSHLQKFLSADEEDNIVAKSQSASVNEVIKIRSQLQKEVVNPNEPPVEEKGNLKQVEINYVKKFQKFQDKKLRISKEDKNALKKAKLEGQVTVMAEAESRRADVLQKLADRHSELLSGKEKSSQVRKDARSDADALHRTFESMKQEIKIRLQEASMIPENKLDMYFKQVFDQIQLMRQLVNESSVVLGGLPLRRAQESIQALTEDLDRVKEVLIPKKKFGFSKKKKEGVAKPEDQIDSHVFKVVEGNFPSLGFCNHVDEDLSLTADDIALKDVSLKDLKNCKVTLKGHPSTIHARGLSGCQVFVGPVQTSVFLHNCVDCIFTTACQQLRVHTTNDCDFYLHVTSRAVIEDCSRLRFAPYDWKYDGIEEDFKKSGLDMQTNNWDSIGDFNWLSPEVKSPNWSTIPEEERRSSFL